MKALHYGAGNIGRGFIGKLLADAGFNLTFADVDDSLVTTLQTQQQYTVHIVGDTCVTETVRPVTAVHAASDAVIDTIAHTDLITTAVGPSVLNRIAPTIAQGIVQRAANQNSAPLNIIAAENMIRGSSQLKTDVYAHLSTSMQHFADQSVGFVDSAVDRIVPPTTNQEKEPLAVTVESFSEWMVDQHQFKGEIPTIPGMVCTDNLMAFIERKLFTLNTGHLVTAYLGLLAGHETIRDAIMDPAVRVQVIAAMEESGAVLIQRYGFDPDAHAAYIRKIVTRFENPYLQDEVRRVGRQPIRKLSPQDRLIRPLTGTLEYGLPNQHLLTGVAAAFHYHNDADPQAVELQAMLAEKGFAETLAYYSGLNHHAEIVKLAEQYIKHSNERESGYHTGDPSEPYNFYANRP